MKDEITNKLALNYRGGLNMFAILVMMGTRYACNISYGRDWTCLQYWSRKGLDMLAMLVTLGTRHACNVSNKGD